MTPIERAKAAIANQVGVSSAPIESFALSDGRTITTEALVRAVLLAIREPSEAMVKAGNSSKPFNVVGYCEGTVHPVVQRSWPAMIDAMLEEG